MRALHTYDAVRKLAGTVRDETLSFAPGWSTMEDNNESDELGVVLDKAGLKHLLRRFQQEKVRYIRTAVVRVAV